MLGVRVAVATLLALPLALVACDDEEPNMDADAEPEEVGDSNVIELRAKTVPMGPHPAQVLLRLGGRHSASTRDQAYRAATGRRPMWIRMLLVVLATLLVMPQAAAAEAREYPVYTRDGLLHLLTTIAEHSEERVPLAAEDAKAMQFVGWARSERPDLNVVLVAPDWESPESTRCEVRIRHVTRDQWGLTVVGDCGAAWNSAWLLQERIRTVYRRFGPARRTAIKGASMALTGPLVLWLWLSAAPACGLDVFCAGEWVVMVGVGAASTLVGVPLLTGGSQGMRRRLLAQDISVIGWPGAASWGFYAVTALAVGSVVGLGSKLSDSQKTVAFVIAGTSYAAATGTGLAQFFISNKQAKRWEQEEAHRQRITVAPVPVVTPKWSGIALSGRF